MVKKCKPKREPPRSGPRGKYKKRTHEYKYEEDRHSRAAAEARKEGGFSLACHKPSYGLVQGTGNRTERGVHDENIRSDHRKRLRRLLNHLMHRHNWTEATGVLAVLLQGTVNDRLPSTNRAKYSAALELLHFIKGASLKWGNVQSVYDLWKKKIRPLKYWSPEVRFAVQVELIMSYCQWGTPDEAEKAVQRLRQEHGFREDPVSHLVFGLVYYRRWYSEIPKELKLTDLNSSGTYVIQPESPIEYGIYASYNNDAPESGIDSSSNTYVHEEEEEDEEASVDADNRQNESKDNDIVTTWIETSHSDAQPQEFRVCSDEGSGEDSDDSLPNSDDDDLPHVSIFCTQGRLPPWLLPLKLPDSHESLDDAISEHRNLRNDDYKCALRHLRAAVKSKPPLLEAFHPLLQMLLMGDQVRKALKLFEKKWFDSSDNILLLRLKATVLEHFDSGNHVKIYSCFENILKKDPTCRDSLGRLIHMHHRGDYDTRNLAEMIALHLDATHGACDTWKELASCLFRLSQCEGDRVSTCHDGSDRHSPEYLDNSNKIPEVFMNSDWRFRCRWWLNRHFPNNILMSDIASGDLELLTYKASAASHLYGRHFKYVVKAMECLKENKMELYSFLQMHSLSSIGFYSMKRNTC